MTPAARQSTTRDVAMALYGTKRDNKKRKRSQLRGSQTSKRASRGSRLSVTQGYCMMITKRHLNSGNLNSSLDGEQKHCSHFFHLSPIQAAHHSRPQNTNLRARHNAGFTMAELLTVVAILAVLAAIAGIAVANYLRDITLTEYDNAAKSIYIAAQNNLADLQANGEWTGESETYTSPDNKTHATPLNNEENKNYTYQQFLLILR